MFALAMSVSRKERPENGKYTHSLFHTDSQTPTSSYLRNQPRDDVDICLINNWSRRLTFSIQQFISKSSETRGWLNGELITVAVIN